MKKKIVVLNKLSFAKTAVSNLTTKETNDVKGGRALTALFATDPWCGVCYIPHTAPQSCVHLC